MLRAERLAADMTYVNVADFGMDTISLSGSLPAKLQAMREAGFTQAMLSAHDLVAHEGGVAAAASVVRASGLRVTGFQTLRDFEGLCGRLHDYKVDVAKSMLEMCAAIGSKILLVDASSAAQTNGDFDAMARDLRKLAMLALPLGIRIAYEGVSSGRTVNDFPHAWDLVCRADAPNLGLGLDAFDAFSSESALEDLDLLDPRKIFLVQLADSMAPATGAAEARAEGAGQRLFPGEGAHSHELSTFVSALDKLGYRGDYSFEVGNDDYRQMPPATVAQRAWCSAVWLGEEVLQRAVPLPGKMRLLRRRA